MTGAQSGAGADVPPAAPPAAGPGFLRRAAYVLAIAVSGGVFALFACLTVVGVRRDRAIAARGLRIPPSPALWGWVHDGGPVLTPDERDSLAARLRAVRQATGVQVAVAVVRDFGGRTPADAGRAVYRAWQLGAAPGAPGGRPGVLLLVVPRGIATTGQTGCWITTGPGAEGVLSDAQVAEICLVSVAPHHGRRRRTDPPRRIAVGLANGVDDIARALVEAGAGGDGERPPDGAP